VSQANTGRLAGLLEKGCNAEFQAVVAEIFRVLKPNGIVYADTGTFDFTRFTRSGHRWLFRHFEEIDSGVSVNAGVALMWSIRYFVRSIGG
jgi:hypothetical protein